MANNDEFKKVDNAPINDVEISKDDFKFVQKDKKIHDQKFETKPTTFFKDCLKRFRKNKSSVVATFILGALLLLSIVVPFACETSEIHDTSVSHPQIKYLEPKLFKSGTGFWDGTTKMTNIAVDTSNPDKSKWAPDPDDFAPNAISKLELGDEEYTKAATKFGRDGFVQIGYYSSIPDDMEYVAYGNASVIENYDFEDTLKVTKFDVYDAARLQASDEKTKTLPHEYVEAESALYLAFDKDNITYSIPLTEYKKAHLVGVSDPEIDVNAKFNEFYNITDTSIHPTWSDKKVKNVIIQARVKNSLNHENSCALVRSIQIKSFATSAIDEKFDAISFVDGTKCMYRTSKDVGYWTNYSNTSYSRVTIYLSKATLCSFVYDTYEAMLGSKVVDLGMTELTEYKNHEYLSFTITSKKNSEGKFVVDPTTFKCKILDEKKCPLAKEFTANDVVLDSKTGVPQKVHCTVMKYKYDFGLESMPLFLLGTDQTGRDMFIYVFKGLRTSLLLGVATTIVCFLFGLLWGSVSGYFGGSVDLVMERFTDILSGVPWVVVMTLTIIKLGSNFLTFAIALCLTGWIGTAATTRTQFYRFRGREYVLASRTLGASHGRLIAKHILPNAMGTIITSAVLMVPSVIFSEATISYLGLGFKNLASLGVILSDNQIELTNHPYLLIFPSIIIALLMISFNLFGNGLRDAVNPSLKGEGE